jgi:hypothetical protein
MAFTFGAAATGSAAAPLFGTGSAASAAVFFGASAHTGAFGAPAFGGPGNNSSGSGSVSGHQGIVAAEEALHQRYRVAAQSGESGVRAFWDDKQNLDAHQALCIGCFAYVLANRQATPPLKYFGTPEKPASK